MEVGNPVVAIGNALGLDATSPSVSVGILSAKGRSLDVDGATLSNALQTDAAINPGNSGGPLLNEAGQVIGINVAVAQGAENIGFAIAVDEARPIIESILSSVGESFIGVNLRDNTADIANRFGLATESGAIVLDVLPGGPADRAGIEGGDIIVAIDGEPMTTAGGVNATIAQLTPGSTVEVRVVRGRQTGSLTVDVEAR
jgi:S1-C subfamily serine protease